MRYYLVWVRSIRYRGNDALTYQHDGDLAVGTVVRVPLQKEHVLGVIVGRSKRPKFTTKLIEAVIPNQPLPPQIISLAGWITSFYPSSVGVATSLILPKDIRPRQLAVAVHSKATPPALPPLTTEQSAALQTIDAPDPYILHGRTGSGKTRIYTEIAKRAISASRSVLVLVPEIGLTSQLAANFEERFPGQIVVLHSRQTAVQRQEAWLRIANSAQPLVVIGPRSALFSPLRNIGAIIIDEAHDQAYKQEQAPYYHALRVAAQLRALHGATLLLGSATPSVTDYYVAQQKQKHIITLRQLAKQTGHDKKVTVVDLKDRSQFTRAPHISLPLAEAISTALERGEQAMLYLNRRGTARVALCQQCGWQALCPKCDVPLTYHGDNHTLRCHICGYRTAALTSCPDCSNMTLTFKSVGTKAIVDQIAKLFPEARTLRFDADNLKDDRLETQYDRILNGEVDILVGTQMITKGLDLPKLSTLGVVLADSSLYIPDYTAHEQTYQLLTQVAGRVGRGHLQGHVVVQTYQPESPLLQAALHDDWEAFYTSEIRERRKYFFPPFCNILKLSCRRATSTSAEKAATAFAGHIESLGIAAQVEGPAPAFHEKVEGKYEWQLIIKTRQRSALLRIVSELPKAGSGWAYDIDPTNLL